MNTLYKGSKGPEVRALQHALNARPYINLDEDGVFWTLTENAVKEFQRRVCLKDDGIYGPKTEAMLWTRVADAVVTLQVPVPVTSNPTVMRPNPPAKPTPPAAQRVAVPPSPPAPPANPSGVVKQISAGTQVGFAPWLMRPTPAPGTPSGNIWSGVFSFALVYRTAKDGPHVELALNPQFLVNSKVQASDPRWGLLVNGQVTFADLIAPGRFHLLSPFIQATVGVGDGVIGGVSAGTQVSFDLIPDKLQFNVQGGAAALWTKLGTSSSSLSVGGQGAASLLYQW